MILVYFCILYFFVVLHFYLIVQLHCHTMIPLMTLPNDSNLHLRILPDNAVGYYGLSSLCSGVQKKHLVFLVCFVHINLYVGSYSGDFWCCLVSNHIFHILFPLIVRFIFILVYFLHMKRIRIDASCWTLWFLDKPL